MEPLADAGVFYIIEVWQKQDISYLVSQIFRNRGVKVQDDTKQVEEIQSTWTVNILVRVLLYLVQSYHEYFHRTSRDYYKSRKPDKILLAEEFFKGADIDIEVKAKVIYESDTDDIINQYIIFCKVFNEQTKQHGMTQKAVTETICICKDRNVLREYLLDREKEVVSIMMSLFDEEQILKSFIRSERHDEVRETAERMIKMGKLSLDEIALCVPSLSLNELRELEAEVMQLV